MAPIEDSVLPEDFLAKPAPDITVHPIDFAQTDLPKYAGLYAVILDDVLSPEECSSLIKAAESTSTIGWERAMINIGGGHQRMVTDVRNCGRIIWDSPDMVDRVWKRIEHIPQVQQITRLRNVPRIVGNGPAKRGEVWRFTRPNERMRFLKYVGGEYFREHCDGSYETPDGKERSYFTLHLYLNGGGAQADGGVPGEGDLVGGATTFHSMMMEKKLDVEPRTGRVLLFQHRDLLHSGDDVVQGVKYTMRTDLMYTLESVQGEEGSKIVEAAKKARARFGL